MLLASSGHLKLDTILLSLAAILLVARLGGSLAERIGAPAVVGEIIAGIILGPSVFGVVTPSDYLSLLSELGVIVLLAEVGLHVDLAGLRRVGRAALSVATLGVVLPMIAGTIAGVLLDESMATSLFLGTALAATSIGITARVFGDLKMLSSIESRIVLGAAVADDVLGLVVLTVVAGTVKSGHIDVLHALSTFGVAILFIVGAGLVGFIVLPRINAFLDERNAGATTSSVVSIITIAAFSGVAALAGLAPIIGAFIAGMAIGASPHRERTSRDLSSLGLVVIPVFFVGIGISTDIHKFVDGHVLALSAVFIVVAGLTKLVSSFGAVRTTADKLTVGIGMIPRGEVGFIVAATGVSLGVFHDDLFAVVILMVLATTVITPPLLKYRARKLSTPRQSISTASSDVLARALSAAVGAATTQPDELVLQWLHEERETPLVWDTAATELLLDVLMRGNVRSWRLLEASNVIDRAFPPIALMLQHRRTDIADLDPNAAMSFPIVTAIRRRMPAPTLNDCALLIAAFMVDITDEPLLTAVDLGFINSLSLPSEVRKEIASLTNASSLLETAVTSLPYEADNLLLAQLAGYLGNPLSVERCRILTECRVALEDEGFAVLLDITTSVQQLLAHPELLDGAYASLEEVRRSEAIGFLNDDSLAYRIDTAPSAFVLAHEPEELARLVQLLHPMPVRGQATVHVDRNGAAWNVHVVAYDMSALLARITDAFRERGLNIVGAALATWPDGAVLDTFTVDASSEPDSEALLSSLNARLSRFNGRKSVRVKNAQLSVTFDHNRHPINTFVNISGDDQPGLLSNIAAAFSRAGVDIHHARIATVDGQVDDRFEVTDRAGNKLSPQIEQRIVKLLS